MNISKFLKSMVDNCNSFCNEMDFISNFINKVYRKLYGEE